MVIIHRGTLKRTKKLSLEIDQCNQQCTLNPRPFVWAAMADSIPEKIKRLCQSIAVMQHRNVLFMKSRNPCRKTTCSQDFSSC
jgi:hypothetical protein